MANESTNRSQALANPPHALVPTTTTMRKRIVLVDFETCICDVDQSVYEGFHAKMASKNVPFSFQTRQHRQLWENYQGDATKAKEETIISASPVQGAIAALHEMKAYGLNVVVVCNPTLAAVKSAWIDKRIGKAWAANAIFCRDKSLLRADFLIDTSSSPSDKTCAYDAGDWTLIILEQPFNQKESQSRRLLNWKNWKTALGIDTLSAHKEASGGGVSPSMAEQPIAWFLHGSEDSRDVDKLYQFKEWPSKGALQAFSYGTSEDRNVFAVSPRGYVSRCVKGLPDEVNNGIYYTYKLHKQDFPLPLLGLSNRCVVLRVVVAMRAILVILRRMGPVRNAVVNALKSFDFEERRSVVKAIKFQDIAVHLTPEDAKYVAFHLAQSLALIEGKELFTKKSIVAEYPKIRPYIYLEQSSFQQDDLIELSRLRDAFINAIAPARTSRKGNYHLFFLSDKHISHSQHNHFTVQCSGTVVELHEERLAHFGPCHPHVSLPSPSWANESDLPDEVIDIQRLVGVFDVGGTRWFAGYSSFTSDLANQAKKLSLNNTDVALLEDTFRSYYVEKAGMTLAFSRWKDSLRVAHLEPSAIKALLL